MTTPDVVTGELVPADDHTLWRTDDPATARGRMEHVAGQLKEMLDRGGMTMQIGANEHVLIGGWQTLGSLLGISPYVVWSRPLEDPQGPQGWEARAEARTVDGRVVGAAEAMTTRDERQWKNADEFAVRSMAQTRAMSKALRGPLGFVMTLAGRSDTPAEEMPSDGPTEAQMPHWAEPIDEDAANRFLDNLELITNATGTHEPAAAAFGAGQALSAFCGNQIPAAAARLAKLLVRAAGLQKPPGVDPLEQDGPDQ